MNFPTRTVRRRFSKIAFLVSSAAIVISAAAAAQTQPQGIAIPAFFTITQNFNGVTPDWIRIRNAGAVAKIVVAGLDTLGAGNGSTTDCLGSPSQMFDCLHQNGQLVLGYVDTTGSARDATCPATNPNCNVIHGADGGFSVDQWYNTFGTHIDGIFFDNGPTSNATGLQTYYQNLYTTVRSTRPGKCGNGNQACVMLNASQVNPDWVVNGPASDFAITYERPVHGTDNDGGCGNPDQQDYFGASATASLGFCPNAQAGGPCADTMSPLGWYFTAANAPKTAHILRKPSQFGTLSNADLDSIIAMGRTNYGSPGFLYVHDQGCLANGAQYNHLSPYFEHIASAFGSAVTVSKSGTGSGSVSSAPAGLSCGSTCSTFSNNLSTGTVVSLSATADAGSTFAGFTLNGASCGNPCSFTVTQPSTVVATFNVPTSPVALTVSKAGTGGGTVTSNPAGISCGATCSASFSSGTTVTLTAAPDANSTFSGFSANCTPVTGTPTQCTITLSAAATVTTTFTGTNVAPVVPPPPLFSDNFNRTTGLGPNWNILYGAYTTDGASAISGTPPINGNWASVVPSMGTNDYAVSSDIVIPAGSLNSGVVARGSTTAFDRDLYSAQISTDGGVHLYRRNAWTWTSLGTSAAGITAGVRYTLKLLVAGSNPVHLEVWLNGALQIQLDDASTSRVVAGVPGIENYDPNVRYSSFAVSPAPLFDDNFTRTTGLGANWKIWFGGFTTNGAAAVSTAPPVNGNWASVVPALNTNNYIVSTDIVIPAGSLFSGIVARGSATQFDGDLYAAQLSTDGSAHLYRRNAWTWTALGAAPLGITANTRYSLKLVVSGSNPVHLEVWVNGIRQIVVDDGSTSSIQAGLPGIQNYDPNVQYSSFAVY